MSPDSDLSPHYQLNCRCGLFVRVEADSLGEAKMKFRDSGCRLIGESHNLRWACARCASTENSHAA